VGSFSGGGASDLQGGPIFFSNAEKQEKKREQGGQHFSRGGGLAPMGPPDATGLVGQFHNSTSSASCMSRIPSKSMTQYT